MPSLSPEVSVAIQATERGAEVVRAAGLEARIPVQAKALPGDYVTEVDVAAERAIATLLEAEGGGVGVHGEEGGGVDIADAWVIDPLDGTTNFAHGFWAVGVSVALVRGGRPVAGAVCAPFIGRTWAAGHGEGAWLLHDGQREGPVRLTVSEREVGRAVVATGSPSGARSYLRDTCARSRARCRRSRTCGARARRRLTWRGSPKGCSTASSSWRWARGTWPPAVC